MVMDEKKNTLEVGANVSCLLFQFIDVSDLKRIE